MGEINWKDKCWVATLYMVRDDGKVLLSWNKQMQTWIPIGGHMEAGETPEDAVKREVLEETGFDFEFLHKSKFENNSEVEIVKFERLQLEKVPHHNMHMNFVFFGKCTRYQEKGETDEKEKLRWFSRDELINEKNEILESVFEMSIKAIDEVAKSNTISS